MSKYIGGFPGEEMRPVTAREFREIADRMFEYGATKAERRRAAMRILEDGGGISDAHGFDVRLTCPPK